MLPELQDEKYVATVARKIISAVARPFVLLGHDYRVTASVGISIYPQDGLDEETLTKNADIAMYRAKEEGKNNFRFYSDQLNTDSLERLALEARLRDALARGEFQLHFQTKRDTRSGRITGVEALLRWQHPDLDRSFIRDIASVAEHKELAKAIIALGRALSLSVVAQGVETREQADFLLRNSCGEYQGFYLDKPAPANQLAQMLRTQADAAAIAAIPVA